MVGIFGGSFDPIHHGHLLIARVIAEKLGLDHVRFVPALEQPLKHEGHRSSATHRAAMVALAIDGERGFMLDRIELDRPGPSYTVDTLRALREREPGIDPVLLLGADAAFDLPRWKEGAAVLQLARVAIFARAGTDTPAIPGAWKQVDVPAIGISATAVRERARAGRSLRYWVPDAVAEYVVAHGLYRTGME